MRAHLLAACGLLAVLSSGAARAETTELGKLDKDKLRQQCTDERGDWAENGDWFVCSKDCEGGECIVICFGEDGCLGSTPERRVSVPVEDRIVAGVLAGRIEERSDGERDDGRFPWGLVGLLGLAGLIGLGGAARAPRQPDKPNA